MIPFAGTRADALKALDEFLDRAPAYSAKRNFVVPGHPHVSRLSPAIRSRLLLEEECINAALARYSLEHLEKWIQEVLWRTYWKGWLELRPAVWTDYKKSLQRLRATAPADVLDRAAGVAAGRGGIAVMDRFARELRETGYLHNHARMWWAAYWIHVERLPWELGADFFLRHLLDGDAASNTLGWRWVAGLQTRGKTYLARRSNLEAFCGGDYLADPARLERLEDHQVTPAMLPPEDILPPVSLPALPVPCDLPACGLLIHEEDGCPESGPLAVLQVKTAVSLPPTEAAPLVTDYRRTAIADTSRRVSLHFECETTTADPHKPAESIATWASQNRLRNVVCMNPSTGPLKDRFADIERTLASAGVSLWPARREWDSRLYPLAQRGFFPFKEMAWKQLASQHDEAH